MTQTPEEDRRNRLTGPKRYSWLLFDADGTLFDYDTAEATALSETFSEFGHDFRPEFLGVYREINAEMWQAFERGTMSQDRLKTERFETFLAAIGSPSDPSVFSTRYMNNLARQTDLIDGALATVDRLSRQARLLLITNGLKDIQRPRFAASAIRGYFVGMVVSEEVGTAKPEGRIFEEAFAQMHHPAKSTVLMVGDSLTSDIEGGSMFGIDTCWFNPRGAQNSTGSTPTFEIRSLRELIEIVEGNIG
jgi:2-haloacid dehalogenase